MATPDNIQMPQPQYDMTTEQALNADLATELDDATILQQHAASQEHHSDTYARQMLLRSQQELAAAQSQVAQLTNTTSQLQQDHQFLRGQLDTLSRTRSEEERNRQQQAQLAQFELTAEEQAAFGDSLPAMDKLIKRALVQQKAELEAEFNQRLQETTNQALQPLTSEISTLKQGTELNQQRSVHLFENTVAQAMQSRGVSLENLMQDPEFIEKVRQPIPGTGHTYFDMLKQANASQNVSRMMEVIDHCRPAQSTHNRLPPHQGQGTAPTSTQSTKNLQKRQQLQTQLEQMEEANSRGDYSKYGNSKKKFMEARNNVLNEIEKHPIT